MRHERRDGDVSAVEVVIERPILVVVSHQPHLGARVQRSEVRPNITGKWMAY